MTKLEIRFAARKRIVLTPSAAREIELLAPSYADSMSRGVKSQTSNSVALRFGVDPKTKRDIWIRKSWRGFNNATTQQCITDSFLSMEECFPLQIDLLESLSLNESGVSSGSPCFSTLYSDQHFEQRTTGTPA